jgi:Tol biopolymer transport system component
MIRRYELDPARAKVRGRPVSLTSLSRSLVEPEISREGTLLVANTRGEPRDDIVVLRTDGTQVRALTEDEPRDRDPRWSPDGRRVAFWSDREGGTALFVIDSDGRHLRQLTGAGIRNRAVPSGRQTDDISPFSRAI